MPTGYTADIKKGISFKDFALGCARAFGACVTLRDEPDKEIPNEFKPSTYYEEKIKELKKEIELLKTMDIKTAGIKAKEEYNKEIKRYKKYIDEANELLKKYEEILLKVEEWRPPTSDHNGLKDFMKEQIETSIKHDCDTSYYNESLQNLKLLTGQEWIDKEIERTTKSLEYYNKEDKKEKERVEGRNDWIRELRKSLGIII